MKDNIKHLSKEEIQILAEERWPSKSPVGEYYDYDKLIHNKNMRRAFIDGCNISQLHYSKEILAFYEDKVNILKEELQKVEKKVD